MNQSISRFFGRLSKTFGGEEVQEVVLPQPEPQQAIEEESTPKTEVEEKKTIVEPKQSVILIEESPKEVQILPPIKIEKTKKKQSDKSRNKIIREPTIFV